MQTRAQAARAARLALRHPQADEAFTCGLGSVLRQWTALELAVFHQWGGDGSGEMASRLIDEIKYLFDMEDKVYKDDVSLLLEDYLETNFSTICEDESPDELGELICNLYNQCGVGNFDLVTNLRDAESLRKGVVAQSVGVDKGDAIDDEDESDADDAEAAEALLEEALEEEIPKVDPDGWEVISKKKSKKTALKK